MNCEGDSKTYLESVCMKLPEDNCMGDMNQLSRCGEYEFDCGDGQCIPGPGVCDGKYQCMNGADENMW